MRYDTLYKEITTSNTGEMLEMLLRDITAVKEGPYRLSTRECYRVKSHEGPFDRAGYDAAKAGKQQGKPFRKEEWMCKMCKGRPFPPVGTIVDYQVPLKASQEDGDGGMGKIDLLAKGEDTAYILEVKVPDSTESPLRAILEIYTYWRQLGGEDAGRFLDRSEAKGAAALKKGIVIFEKAPEASGKYLYQKLRAQWGPFSDLMGALDVECFVAALKKDSPDCDEIVRLDLCKL